MITSSQVFEAREKAGADDTGIIPALVALGFVTEEDIMRTIAAASNMEFVDLGSDPGPPGDRRSAAARQGLPLQGGADLAERRRAWSWRSAIR